MDLRGHHFRGHVARSDSEIRSEMRHVYLRHGSDESRFMTWIRLAMLAVCVVGTIFLIFKTLYSPAIKAAKPPIIGVAKAAD